MPYLLVQHEVEDFDYWYSIFQSHFPAHKKAGFSDLQLFRDEEVPNKISILYKIEDIATAMEFMNAPEGPEMRASARVIGSPTVTFLNKVE